jgi:hypothetical protein
MRHEEAIFREVETELNSLLSSARPELESSGVEIKAQTPDPRDYLSWDVWFTKSWSGPVGHELAQVTVLLSCMEPVPGKEDVEVRLWAAAEIFQIGQLSRIRETSDTKISREHLRSSGVGNIVLEKIGWGHNLLMSAENWR